MGTGNFSDDFKRDAVAQITERGYPVAEVWPAAGFLDTEIRCFTELESWNAETEVQPRVQA